MRILIIKIGALGDVVRTSFIAQALNDKYKTKNPKIFWLTDEKARFIFINNPYVQRVINTENKESLRGIKFDLVINLEEDNESCKFASSLNSREIIGFIYKNGKIIPTTTAKEWFDMSALGEKPKNNLLKKQNKKTHRQIMAEIIKVDPEKYEPFLRLTNKQRRIADAFLRRYHLSRTDLIIGINTGSAERWPKQLSIKKTVQLIDKLYRKYKPSILLFGGPNEVERNKEILKLTKVPVIHTGCGNDLLEFPALISVCSLFVTTDTLGLHVALALKRKTICLIGPTSPAEIDMYGLGYRIIAKSQCICCYKRDCKSMEKIDVDEILGGIKKLISSKITLVITAFKEPNIAKAIEAALNQKTRYDYDIFISAPDEQTLDIVKKYSIKNKKIRAFKDPGKGKSYALNLIFGSIKSDILILTDGDVRISENAVEEISNLFLDPEIGCVSGRPVPIENKKTKYGFWANFLLDSAHRIRKKAFEDNSFIECSAYLFAFMRNQIKNIPVDVAEDAVIPYRFWEKGYRIGYAEKALVFVKNPHYWADWIKQKIRTSKAHETLQKYVDVKKIPRVKTFMNEAKGIKLLISYPESIKQVLWTIQLTFARLYMWTKVFIETKLLEKHYGDAWERVESTK